MKPLSDSICTCSTSGNAFTVVWFHLPNGSVADSAGTVPSPDTKVVETGPW